MRAATKARMMTESTSERMIRIMGLGAGNRHRFPFAKGGGTVG